MECAVCGKIAIGSIGSNYRWQFALCKEHMKRAVKENDEYPDWVLDIYKKN